MLITLGLNWMPSNPTTNTKTSQSMWSVETHPSVPFLTGCFLKIQSNDSTNLTSFFVYSIRQLSALFVGFHFVSEKLPSQHEEVHLTHREFPATCRFIIFFFGRVRITCENRLLASHFFPSTWNDSASIGRIFVKFDFGVVFRRSVEKKFNCITI